MLGVPTDNPGRALVQRRRAGSNVTTMTVLEDNYTGHVEPRTAARRTLPGASIVKVSVGPMDNNAYLVTCSQTGETLLIDAANDPAILLELIEQYAPSSSLIVTTHQHQDHWLALSEVAEIHRRPDRRAPPGRRTAARHTRSAAGRRRHRHVGDLSFDVIHLRGHTPGSVALALSGPAAGDEVQLFTGDCLFPGGVGKTWKEGDFEQLLGDVTSRVFDVYSDATSSTPGMATTRR